MPYKGQHLILVIALMTCSSSGSAVSAQSTAQKTEQSAGHEPQILIRKKKMALKLARQGKAEIDHIELEKAAQSLKTSLEITPTAEAYLYLSELASYKEDTKTAVINLQKAQELSGKDWALNDRIAELYTALHLPKKACSIYQTAVAANPDDLSRITKYAGCLYEDKRYQEAITQIEKLIAKTPSPTTLCANVGNPKATKEMKAMNELCFAAYSRRGFCQLQLGKNKDALADLTLANRLVPVDIDALKGRMTAMERLGMTEQLKTLKSQMKLRERQEDDHLKTMINVWRD